MTQKLVTVRGPLFNANVPITVRRAVQRTISAVSKAAVKEVRAELTPGHGVASGEYRKSVRYKTRGLTSRVYGRDARKRTWLEGTSKLNARSKFKGYGIMRRAFERTDATAGKLARDFVEQLANELGGS